MSQWTHIFGLIRVHPMGRTQAEKTYILQTVLEHLPVVTGSEEDLEVIINQEPGYDSSSSVDELGYRTNNLRDRYGRRSREDGFLRTQESYLLTLSGHFRDRSFEMIYRSFINWLCRLSKRVIVGKVIVEVVEDYGKRSLIQEDYQSMYRDMFEEPSWGMTGSSNWCEYLMWEENMVQEDCRSESIEKDVINECTVCSDNYHREIVTEVISYHTSYEETKRTIMTKYCPNCGRELNNKI